MAELDIDALLTRAAASTTYPPTPSVAARMPRLLERAPRSRAPRWRVPAIALAAACVAVAGTLAAVPSSRTAIADLFRVRGSVVHVATPAAGVTPTALPTPQGIEFSATPVAAGDVAASFGFEPAVPASEGAPMTAYVVDYLGLKVGVLHYERFDLWEADLSALPPGASGEALFSKSLGGGTRLQEVAVQGAPAYWISGGAHMVEFRDADGRVAAASVRAVGRNTLIWRTERLFYRLETDLPLEDALAVAAQLP